MINETIATILGNDDINVNKYISKKLNILYPDINLDIIDNDLLENIIVNIISEDYSNINKLKKNMMENIKNISNNNDDKLNNNKTINGDKIINNIIDANKNNFNKEIIKQNILMADEIIPEMTIPTNLIYLKGKLNGIKTNIMIDTGASSCVIFKSVVDKCGLDYLLDSSTSVMVQGAHGTKPTLGTIWFTEIEIEIDFDKWVSIPISIEVIDDSETIKTNEIIKEHHKQINKIIGSNDLDNTKDDNTEETRGFEIILGMTFLKSYRANIDFSTMTITLNKNIKIKFN
jgi:hypothetical protein